MCLDLFGRGWTRQDQQTIPKGYGLLWFQREVQFLFAVAENLLAERIGGEQAIAARVPVSRKAGVPGMIQDDQRDGFLTDLTRQHGPTRPRAPDRVAGLSLAAAILTSDAGIIQNLYGRRAATRVRERQWLV